MIGIVTKKDFFAIVRSFGLVKGLRILFSRKNIALNILMK